MGPIIVQMTLTVPTAIFAEAFLSFLGLGVQFPFASWGVMANDALTTILSGHWWRLFFHAFFISATMFAFNVLGDGLQDALDPETQEVTPMKKILEVNDLHVTFSTYGGEIKGCPRR